MRPKKTRRTMKMRMMRTKGVGIPARVARPGSGTGGTPLEYALVCIYSRIPNKSRGRGVRRETPQGGGL